MIGNISKKRVDMEVANSIKETLDVTKKVAGNVNSAVEKYPHIGENKNWFVWDSALGRFVDTGIKAEGAQCVGKVGKGKNSEVFNRQRCAATDFDHAM